MGKNEKLVLLDADVIIHLFKAGKLSLLQSLFPKRIIILDLVFEELLKNPVIRDRAQNLITLNVAALVDFPTHNREALNEYNSLRNTKGKGESACLALCRYDQKILASSNLSDTKTYCLTYHIEYVTTLDILTIAHLKGFINEADADQAIYDVKSKGSILPKQFGNH